MRLTFNDSVLYFDFLIDAVVNLPDANPVAIDPLLLVDEAAFDFFALLSVFEALLKS